MVVIRLARHGRHKYPTYRIVAADKRRAVTSKFLAILGTYNPHTKEIVLKKDEIQEYLDNGAQASDRVLRLLVREGIELPKWAKTHDRFKKSKKEEAESQDDKDGAATQDSPEASDGKNDSNAESTDQVAQESSANVEPKQEQIKNDVGTQKENEDANDQADTSEKVAEAVEKTVDSKPKE